MIENEFKRKQSILEQYQNNVRKLIRLRNKLNIIKSSLGVKSLRYTEVTSGGVAISHEDMIIEKIELEKRIEELVDYQTKQKKIIIDALDKLDNDKYSEVLEWHYFDLIPLPEIAMKMNRDKRTIERYLKRAIAKIDL